MYRASATENVFVWIAFVSKLVSLLFAKYIRFAIRNILTLQQSYMQWCELKIMWILAFQMNSLHSISQFQIHCGNALTV